MNIKIDNNSDCAGEIELLSEMLKANTGYIYKDFSRREIVEIAINELYDKLVSERKAGTKQRKI